MNINYNKYYLNFLYIFLLGILSSFSLPPYNYWFLNFFTISIVFIIFYKNLNLSFKTIILFGYSFGFGYFFSSLYWIPFSLSYDENFKFLIPLAMIIIPAFLSIFYALAFGMAKLFINSNSIISNILIFSLSLSFFEFLRGHILSGFPWNLFAYSLSNNINLIQINSVIGVYAFNLVIITIFLSPSVLYLSRSKANLFGFSVILIVFIFLHVFGLLKIRNFNSLDNKILSADIKLLSTNIPIDRFYSNLDDEVVLKKLINLSNAELDKSTIFIWPEGVIPNINLKDFKNEYNYLIERSFSDNHIIILGINDENENFKKKNYFNSLSIINNKSDILYKYYKNKLVPFGEFIPFENFLSKFGFKSLTNNYQSYTAGKTRELFSFEKDNKIKILPLICYEIIYSGNISRSTEYTFIINISEDGWFGNSIGPYQHYAHTIFRSIEYGKYTLRSANNGISAIINPIGIAVDKININTEGTLSLNQIKDVDKTFFSKFGNKIYFLIILLYIFLIFSFKKSKNE